MTNPDSDTNKCLVCGKAWQGDKKHECTDSLSQKQLKELVDIILSKNGDALSKAKLIQILLSQEIIKELESRPKPGDKDYEMFREAPNIWFTQRISYWKEQSNE